MPSIEEADDTIMVITDGVQGLPGPSGLAAFVADVPADWDDNPPATLADALNRIAAHLGPIL